MFFFSITMLTIINKEYEKESYPDNFVNGVIGQFCSR